MSEARERGPARAVLTGIAAVLFVHGQTSEGTRLSLARLAHALDLDARVLLRWGLLALTDPAGRPLALLPSEPTAVDIGRVVAAERLVDAVCAGTVSPERAAAASAAIGGQPPVGLARFAGMAGAGAAALAVIFGAQTLLTLCLVAAVAGAGACLRRVLAHGSGNPFLQPFAAALLAGLVGGGLSRIDAAPGAAAWAGAAWAGAVSHYLLVVCPCMVLVPGPHFLNGAIELARAHVALGFARIAFAMLIVLAICAGVLTGLALTGAAFPGGGVAPPVPLIHDVAAAGVAVAAYGAFFNMPWRMLPTPIAIGMLAHGVRWGLLHQGASLQVGALVACLVVGSLMTPVAHRLRMPFGACAFSAVVSLIPGAYMFAAVAGLMGLAVPGAGASPETVSRVLANATDAAAILLAMTAGLVAPKIALDAIHPDRRRHGDGRPARDAKANPTLATRTPAP